MHYSVEVEQAEDSTAIVGVAIAVVGVDLGVRIQGLATRGRANWFRYLMLMRFLALTLSTDFGF